MYNSLIAGHADSDKKMKWFSNLRYEGKRH